MGLKVPFTKEQEKMLVGLVEQMIPVGKGRFSSKPSDITLQTWYLICDELVVDRCHWKVLVNKYHQLDKKSKKHGAEIAKKAFENLTQEQRLRVAQNARGYF